MVFAMVIYPVIIAGWIAYQFLYLGQALNNELTMVNK